MFSFIGTICVCPVLPLLSRWRSCRGACGLSLQRPSCRPRSSSGGDCPPNRPQRSTSRFPTQTTKMRPGTRSMPPRSPSGTSGRPLRRTGAGLRPLRRALASCQWSEKMSCSSPAPPAHCRAACCPPGNTLTPGLEKP